MPITGVPATTVDPVAALLAALQAITYADKGNWATTTAYVVGDIATQSGQRYLCRTAHTSGTFATDLAASKWVSLDAVAALAASNNLSDLASASTARTNLGLGTAATISATAGGDLSGTLPSPTVAKVNGVAVSGTPSNGQVLTATGTTAATWSPAASGADKLGLTPTTVKTTIYTAVVGDLVPVDTTSGSVTITFPTAPADGSVVAVKHVARGGTNTVSLALGGSDKFNVTGGATTGTLTLVNQGIIAQYKSSSSLWYVVADDLPLSGLDSRYLQVSNNLSDVTASTARTNLGLGTAATLASSAVAQTANNLSDLASASTARTNLGAGSASGLATLDGSTLVPTAQMGTGAADSTKVLQGDRTWATAVSLAQSGQTPSQAPIGASLTSSVGSLAYAARADHSHPSMGLYLWFGDGSDGTITLDGSSAVTGFSRSGSTYTYTGGFMFPANLTVNSGVTLILAGRIFCQGTLTNNGTIRTPLLDAVVDIAASNTTVGNGGWTGVGGQSLIPLGRQGSSGGTGAGSNPGLASQSAYLGGSGGAGGAGSPGAAGAAQAAWISNANALMLLRNPFVAMSNLVPWIDKAESTSFANPYLARGGVAGGSGGGDGTNKGGGGGGGGNWLPINARLLAGNGVFSAPGGAGGTPSTGNCGGGGGGGGGVAQVITTDSTNWSGTLTAVGGAGGTATGTGAAGSAGGTGTTLLQVIK